MNRLCVLDCDGTLVDGQHAIIEAMAAAFSSQGMATPAAEAVRGVVGLSLTEAVAALVPGADPAVWARIAEAYRDAFADQRRRGDVLEPLYPDAREALDALDGDGWLLAIATGKSLRGLRETLAMHGLERRFVSLQTPDAAPGKPAPDMVLRAAAEAGAEAASTVVVGDTTFDVLMARNAGAVAVGVAWGYHPTDRLISAGAAVVVDAFGQLPSAVRRVSGER